MLIRNGYYPNVQESSAVSARKAGSDLRSGWFLAAGQMFEDVTE